MGGYKWGGSEALWHAVAEYALEKNDEILVSVYEWDTPHQKILALKEKGAKVFYRSKFNPNAGFLERAIRFIKNRKPSFNKNYQSIINFKPEKIFISQGDNFDIAVHHRALYELIQQNNIPYYFVCHSHEQYSFLPQKEIYPSGIKIFTNAKQVFFVSKKQWQLTERKLVTKLSNASITWNPLNLSIPSKPLEWPSTSTINFAIVGSLITGKGHDTIFEVLSSDIWKNRLFKLNVYGLGDGESYLKALAKFYEIEARINFYGYVDNVIKIWEVNHILLIPSSAEGLPISLVEAMACGRLAVVTDVGGNTELICEGITGFVAEAPSVVSFKDALDRAWEQKENWLSIGNACFNKVTSVLNRLPQKDIYEKMKDDR
jgi:L-malate glycosyltransferase